jgi:alanine racemase
MTWVEVDRRAIAANVRRMAEVTGTAVMAVVKANGYGHGMVEVARAAVSAGAAGLGVARLDEGLELRAAEVQAPVLVLGALPDGRWPEAVAAGVQGSVWSETQLRAAARAGRDLGRPARVHLKVDSGMSRLGADLREARGLARLLADTDGLAWEGIFTHFARADEPAAPTTLEQWRRFQTVIEQLESDGLRPRWVHAANSAAALQFPEMRADMVRAGIALLGLSPSAECRLPQGFAAALTWKARVTAVREVPAGTGVSYGHEYVTARRERIAVVAVGYGDGYRRVPGNRMLVRGRPVPVVGRVCMDQVMVSVDDAPEASVGDEAILLGEQNGLALTADDVARAWGTVSYEVVCALSARVPRVYLG